MHSKYRVWPFKMLHVVIRKKRTLCLITFIAALVIVSWTVVLQKKMFLPDAVTKYVCPLPPSHMADILLDLNAVVVQLQRTPGLNEKWSKDMEEQLVGVIRQLDREYEPPLRLSDVQISLVSRSASPEYCPKKFVHSSLAAPYYLSGSWLPVQACTKLMPLESLVSVIIYWTENSSTCAKRLDHLLAAIERTHQSMRVYVAIDKSTCQWDDSSWEVTSVRVTNVDSSRRPGQVWNSLASKVKTPYTLVGNGLEDFSWLTNIRRQVSILSSDPLVRVVSGSVRNSTGHWQVGCYQSFLHNYILEYRDGYFLSKNECMFCDHVLGPFITKSKTLVSTPLDEGLASSVIFEDWFLRLKAASKLVMNCPDAMYFATDTFLNDKLIQSSSWLTLVLKWQLNRLILPENIKMSFSCAESGLECSEMYVLTGKQMMPICCMDQLANAMRDFHELCAEHNLLYNYIGGSVLGAVKFRGIIPWDFDGDAEYYVENLSLYQQWSSVQKSKGKGVFMADLNQKAPGYFRLMTPEMFVEMWPANKTAADQVMPNVFKRVPTKMRVHGVWVYGPPSPGLHVRNMYGKEVLRHSSSWYHTGKKEWTDPYSVRRHFVPCKNYGHHACASRFTTDGSFQFLIP